MKKFMIILLIMILIGVIGYYGYTTYFKEEKVDETKLIEESKEKFNGFAITNKESNIYKKDKEEYKLIGTISKDEKIKIVDSESIYFMIEGLDYYIDYKDIDPIIDITDSNNRYKDYIVFNENIITKDNTMFYDENNKLVFTLNESFDLPIIIKDDNKYGIEFNNKLYYINDSDVEKTYEKENTKEETRSNMRTLTYHTVYDPSTQKCTSIEICHTISQFESHMKYLNENKYLTLTMEELEMFLDKKIRVPKNTIAITLDDGIFLENSIPLVEKYEIYATFFIITSKVDVSSHFDSAYARFESHTDDLHNNYKCPLNSASSQGGQMLCEKKENIVADLKLSQEKLDESYYFAYPFFDFNDNAISALKEANFKMAFIGQWNTNGYSDYNTDRFMLRRKTVFGNLSMEGFIDYLT